MTQKLEFLRYVQQSPVYQLWSEQPKRIATAHIADHDPKRDESQNHELSVDLANHPVAIAILVGLMDCGTNASSEGVRIVRGCTHAA